MIDTLLRMSGGPYLLGEYSFVILSLYALILVVALPIGLFLAE